MQVNQNTFHQNMPANMGSGITLFYSFQDIYIHQGQDDSCRRQVRRSS